MKSKAQILLLPLLLVPALFGQTVPAPIFVGKPLAGDTEIVLRISEPAGGTPVVLRLVKKGTPVTGLVLGPVVSNGEVRVQLPADVELAGGDDLVARQVLNGVESLPASYLVPKLGAPTVEIRTAQAFFAHNVIPLTFKMTDADGATVVVKQNGKPLLSGQKLDGDEIKKGKAEVTLPQPLASAEKLTLEVTAKRAGAASTVVSIPVRVQGLQFRFDNAPLEGEQELTGKSASYIKGMVIYAFGGAFSQAPVDRFGKALRARTPSGTAAPKPSSGTVTTSSVKEGASDVPKNRAASLRTEVIDSLKDQFRQRLKIEILDWNPDSTGASGPEKGNPEGSSASGGGKAATPQTIAQQLDEEDFASNTFRDALFTDTAIVEKGSFKFTLKHRLDAGQRLVLCAVIENEPGMSRHVCDQTNHVVRSAGLDFGRMRAFFSAGTVLSSGNNSFGKADPYLAFNSDLVFMNSLVRRRDEVPASKEEKKGVWSAKDDQRAAEIDGLEAFRNQKFGISFHGILDARLTQAPVDAKADSGTAATALLGPKAQQAATMQGGFYVPMRFSGMDWVYNGTQYSAYFAPVVKLGATMLKDGVTLSTKSTQTTVKTEDLLRPNGAAKVTAGDPVMKPLTTTNPLPFYGYGVRLGVMRYDLMGKSMRNRQIAPDNISYVDLTYGQNGVYRRVGPSSTATAETVVTADSVRTTTLTSTTSNSHLIVPGIAVEGRMKLPHLPAQVGVDMFIHRRRPDAASTLDFRFILGFRIDVAKALGRAFGVTP